MQAAAPTEPGDLNSPHLDSVFWDLYDPLTDYVSFDIGNCQPRQQFDRRIPPPIPAPVWVNHHLNKYAVHILPPMFHSLIIMALVVLLA